MNQSQNDPLNPYPPKSIEETGLDFGFLSDLTLKTVYADTNCSTERTAEKLCLPMWMAEIFLQHLYQEKLIEIRGIVGFQNHRYALLDKGWQWANRLLDLNGYIGPAPVSLQQYTDMVLLQSRERKGVTKEDIENALADLVLSGETKQTLGLVLNSWRSLFIYGEPGNGKTSSASAIHNAQQGEVWIPYAIEVDRQIIKIFDQHNHEMVGNGNGHDNGYDKRWIKIKRPLVIVGGELTIDTMDLVFSRSVRYYEAPFQMKANCGTLVIDDFGRQRVDAKDLLNRWIIPLERQTDYLTLHTGKKIEVPFETLLIFATNLDPKGLVDEAFLRRMGYRLYIGPPDRKRYKAIFEKEVESNGFELDPELVEFLFKLYEKEGRPLRCCEPRDLLLRCHDICLYEDRPLGLSLDLLKLAWTNYFGIR